LGKDFLVGSEGWHHFMLFGDLFRIKDARRVRYLIWLAVTWNNWRLRNEVILQGVHQMLHLLLTILKDLIGRGFLAVFVGKLVFLFLVGV
jgi:hypothetical protein